MADLARQTRVFGGGGVRAGKGPEANAFKCISISTMVTVYTHTGATHMDMDMDMDRTSKRNTACTQ